MAVENKKTSGQSSTGSAAGDATGPGMNYTAGAVPGAESGVSMTSLLHRFTHHALPPEAETYLNKLMEGLEKYDIGIATHKLINPAGAYAFVSGGKAMVIIFSDMVNAPSQPPHAPKSRNIEMVVDSLKQLPGNITMLNSILVQSVDFPKVNSMIQHIGNILVISTQEELPVSITTIAHGNQYVVDRNVDAVKAFVGQFYPHSVLPRMDVGLLVSLRRRQDPYAREGMLEQDTPVMAIGAYTDLVETRLNDGTLKYQPIVRVTNISAPIPLPGLMLMGAYLAAEHLCNGLGWVDHYRSFGKNKPNLGNLIVEDGKLWSTKTSEELDVVVRRDMLPAMLAVDVCEGQARIPSMIAFADTAHGTTGLVDYIANFFGGQPLQLSEPVTIQAQPEYVGVYGDPNGTLHDTRDYTYLDSIARHGAGMAEPARPLLHTWNNPNPEYKANVVAQLSGGFQSLHQCTSAVLSPEFLGKFGALLAQSGIQMTAVQPTMGTGAAASLMAHAAQMGNLQRVTGNPAMSWNPGMGGIGNYNMGF